MKRNLNAWLPFAVIAAISICWAGTLFWPGTQPTVSPSQTPPSEKQTPPTSAIPLESKPVAPEGSGAWPAYHGDANLLGAVDTAFPDQLSMLWRFQAKGPVSSPPVAASNRIYFSTAKGETVALDYQGAKVWSTELVRKTNPDGTQVMERLDAPIACFGGIVLIGTQNGTLYALDAESGNQLWTYDVGGPVLGSVSWYSTPGETQSSRVFVISQDDGILNCVDAKTGQRIWQGPSIERCDGSPSVTDDRVVFGSCAAALHVFSVSTGQLLHNIDLGGDSQVASGVALSGDSAFFGSHSGKIFHANIRIGSIVWVNKDATAEVFATPAVDAAWVVCASFDGNVYALDRNTGVRKWTFPTGDEPSSPVIVRDKVLVSSSGALHMLRLADGEEVWSNTVSDTITSPAIINGMAVVGSDDGTVTAFGPAQQ